LLKDPRYQSNNPNNGTILHRGGHRPYCEAQIQSDGEKPHMNDCEWPSRLGNPPWLASPQGISTPDTANNPAINEIDGLKAKIKELEDARKIPNAPLVSEEDRLRAQIAELEAGNTGTTGNTIPNNATTTSPRVKKTPDFIPLVLRNGFGVIENPLGFSCKYDISHTGKQTVRYVEFAPAIAGQSANGDALLGGIVHFNKQYNNVQQDNTVIVVPKGTIVTINGNVI